MRTSVPRLSAERGPRLAAPNMRLVPASRAAPERRRTGGATFVGAPAPRQAGNQLAGMRQSGLGSARGSPPRGTVHRLWSGNRAADVLRVAKGPRRTIACRCSQSASNSYAKPSRINSLAVSGSAARAPSAKHSAALSRSSSSIPKLASVASAKVNRTNYLAFYASIYAQERGSRMRKRLDEAFTPRVPPGLPPLPRSLGDRSGVEA